MKRIFVGLLLFLMVGCGEKKPEPVKDTIDTIQESKKNMTVIQVNNLFKEAEMKWISGSDKKCINVKELTTSAQEGSICMDDKQTIFAKDVKIDNLVCNGSKTTLNCVGGSND